MTVLLIHRDRRRPADAADLVLLAVLGPTPAADRAPHAGDVVHVELLAAGTGPDAVLARAHTLAARFAVRRVVAVDGRDQEVAARVRERAELPGPWTLDLLPFRDGAEMRYRARRGGLPVAPYCLPRDAAEAWAFAGRHGFPLVARPRLAERGAPRVLRSHGELADQLAAGIAAREAEQWLLERLPAGAPFHVDGLVVADGTLVLARPARGGPAGAPLDADDPLASRLVGVAERALRAMDRPGGRMRERAFRAEIVHTADDRLLLTGLTARPDDPDGAAFAALASADLHRPRGGAGSPAARDGRPAPLGVAA